MNELKQKAFSGIKWTGISSIATAIFKLMQVCVLTRFVSQSDFGVVAIALLFISFSDILVDMGLTSAVLHRQHITIKQYSSLFWINIILSILLAVILYLIAPIIADFYSEDRLTNIVRLLSSSILFVGISRLHRTYLYKVLCFKFLSVIELIGAVGTFILLVIFALYGLGIYSLVYSNIIVSIISSIVLFVYGQKKNIRFRFYFRYSKISSFLKIGFYQFASSCLDFFSREIDVLIIGSIYPMEIIGGYALCKQLVVKMYGVLNPILSKVLTPVLAIIQSDKNKIKSIYSQIIELLSFYNYPLYFCLAAMSYPLLTVLYGESYSDNYLILSIIAITYGINSVASPVGNLEIALGRTDLGFYWTICRVISVVLFIYLFSNFSILILSLALFVLTVGSMLPFAVFLIKRMINLGICEYFVLQLKPFVASLVIMIPLLFQREIYSIYISIILFPIIFLVGYLGIISFLSKQLVLRNFRYFLYIVKI